MPTARVFSYSDSKSPILAALFAAALLLFAAPQPTHAQTLTTLWSFTGLIGANPDFGALLLDRSGTLYGTTFGGGSSGLGTIFKVSSSGRAYLLHSFVFADGCAPYGGLVRDNADNFYGTTSSCGHGTVFRFNPLRGTFNVMHSFAGGADGAQPYSSLLRDGAGNIYGTTSRGGAAGCGALGCGTVFKVTAAGIETVLYAFTGSTDGENPVGALATDASGNLYGTTGQGGTQCCGTVFELTPTGNETSLFSFNFTDGTGPGPNRLLRDAQGNLFGTTTGGGAAGNGTIFELSNTGVETVLYNFTGAADGSNPTGGIIRDSHGNFYGTTSSGGGQGCAAGCGTVYELTLSGTFKILYTFTGTSDGGNPTGGLAMDTSGNLYGTTNSGGTSGYGTVFKLTP
jgi:uncharacterized repeat protein (TIGR03803 family)